MSDQDVAASEGIKPLPARRRIRLSSGVRYPQLREAFIRVGFAFLTLAIALVFYIGVKA